MRPPNASNRTLMLPESSVILRRGACDRAVQGPTHANGTFELSLVLSGQLDFLLDRRTLSIPRGGCAVLPPEVVNTPRVRSVSLCQVHLHVESLAEARDALGPAARPPSEPLVLPADHGAARLVELIARDASLAGPDAGVSALIDALRFALLRPQAPARREPLDGRVRRALDRVAVDYGSSLSVDALAADAGMSRSAFLRVFRAQVGQSPYQHLLSVRLDQAARRLAEGDEPVLAVALACGFGDPGRFARFFRARFGLSPLRYRQRRGG